MLQRGHGAFLSVLRTPAPAPGTAHIFTDH
jgi:hypothetical protein